MSENTQDNTNIEDKSNEENNTQQVEAETQIVGEDESVEADQSESKGEEETQVTKETTEEVEESNSRKSSEKKKRKKKKKKHRSRDDSGSALLDREAEESSDEEGGVASSDEEEGEEIDDYERDGFVVDEPGEEEEVGADGEKKRKRRKKPADYQLDEDDLELIGQTGAPRQSEDKEKFKRLKRMKTNDDDAEELPELKSKLEESLFGDEEEEEEVEEPSAPQTGQQDLLRDFSESESEDDLSTFIVDENDQPQKQRKHGRRGYKISNEQLSQAASIFGDYTEFLKASGEGEYIPQEKDVAPKLHEVFEPELLESKFLTEAAAKVRETDIPERYQIQFPDRSKPTDQEIKEEAEWIYQRAFAGLQDMPMQSVVPKIAYVLEFLRKDILEVPFILAYRKDYFMPDLSGSDLWEIYDWDEKWAHLQTKKAAVGELYKKANLSEDLYNLLDQSTTEIEMQDLIDHYQLHFLEQQNQTSESTTEAAQPPPPKYKRAIKRDLYKTAKKAGLGEFAKLFGLSASQFGENLLKNFIANIPTDQDKSPEDLAINFICKEFSDIDTVLRFTRYIIAQELAFDPQVRQIVRAIYEKRVEISTYPTDRGRSEIDISHPYKIISRIEKKPGTEMKKSPQFLEMLKAERDGFISIKLEIPQEYHENDILKEMEALYLSDSSSVSGQAWNDQRKLILQEALSSHLYPILEKEYKQNLLEHSRMLVARNCAEELNKKILAGPYKPPADENNDENQPVRVMSCIWGQGKEPTMCTILDPEGEIISHLKLNVLPDMRRPGAVDDPENKLVSFIKEYRPRVVAIGGQLEARKLLDDIHYIVETLHKKENTPPVHVTYVDTEAPRIFQYSERAKSEFPEYPPVLRQAISLGRLLMDPLCELAGLCNEQGEIMFLRLHPLQDMVGREYLQKILYRCFITVVNAVGVDINKAAAHKHGSYVLQFVAGLGPIKAAALLDSIFREGGKLMLRESLEHMVGPRCFTNCAGFIRIFDKYFTRLNEDLNPLDNTRIHPDDYNLVKKMATDALEKDEEDLTALILLLMAKPEKLEDIELDVFAEELERNGIPKKRSILYDIKAEIEHPFKDPRPDYRDPDPDELFAVLTGETEQSLREGLLVNARIMSISERSLRCKLESGLSGIIFLNDVSDSRPGSMKDLALEEGQTIPCRVKKIDKPKFEVILTCKSSELKNESWDKDYLKSRADQEPYFNRYEEHDIKNVKKKKKATFIHRAIEHPLFHNMSAPDAEKYLADKDVGEIVIRPSSRGPTFLTITWKIHENIYVHYNIREEEKPNLLSIGKKLFIGSEQFEDLNEILARFIDPVIMYCKELMNYRSYRDAPIEDIDNLLQTEKSTKPNRIPYYIHLDPEHPGKFLLSYIPNTRVKRDYINVTPEGYRLRKVAFADPERMISWFKKHYKDPVQPEHFHADNDSSVPMETDSYHRNQGPIPNRPPNANVGWTSGGWDQPPAQEWGQQQAMDMDIDNPPPKNGPPFGRPPSGRSRGGHHGQYNRRDNFRGRGGGRGGSRGGRGGGGHSHRGNQHHRGGPRPHHGRGAPPMQNPLPHHQAPPPFPPPQQQQWVNRPW